MSSSFEVRIRLSKDEQMWLRERFSRIKELNDELNRALGANKFARTRGLRVAMDRERIYLGSFFLGHMSLERPEPIAQKAASDIWQAQLRRDLGAAELVKELQYLQARGFVVDVFNLGRLQGLCESVAKGQKVNGIKTRNAANPSS